MLLMLAALGLAIFGVVQLGRTLTPGQRVALALTFVFVLFWLDLWLIKIGALGRASDAAS